MPQLKLIIKDHADTSVGIFESTYEIDCPFTSDADTDMRYYFAKFALSLYAEYAEGKVSCFYSDATYEIILPA